MMLKIFSDMSNVDCLTCFKCKRVPQVHFHTYQAFFSVKTGI